MAIDYHLESIDEVSGFFNRLQPLHQMTTEPTLKNITQLNYWLNDAYALLQQNNFFVNVGYSRLMNSLSKISNVHPKFAEIIDNYIQENSDFMILLLRESRENFNHFRTQEFCNFLNALGHLRIHPDENWLEDWFYHTQGLIVQFNPRDLSESIHAIALLHVMPPPQWLELWFLNSQIQLRVMDPVLACRMMINLARLGIEPPKEWMDEWENHVMQLMSILPDRDLFEMGECFNLTIIQESILFHSLWFSLTHQVMKNSDLHYVIRSIFSLIYWDVSIPQQWISLWYNTILLHLDKVSCVDVINILYSMSLRQEKPDIAGPIVNIIVNYLAKNQHPEHHIKDLTTFRKLFIAHKYFDMVGFTIPVNEGYYAHHMAEWKAVPRVISQLHQDVIKYLQHNFNCEIFCEHFIHEIYDCVDIYIPSKKMVIEIDGKSHYIKGHHNPLTLLKTKLLKNAGYNIVRLEVNKLRNLGEGYIESSLHDASYT